MKSVIVQYLSRLVSVTYVMRRSCECMTRAAIVCGCLAGIWWTVNEARAGLLASHAEAASLRAAIRLVPDRPGYYLRLAQFDREHARSLLDAALRANPYNAATETELGLLLE